MHGTYQRQTASDIEAGKPLCATIEQAIDSLRGSLEATLDVIMRRLCRLRGADAAGKGKVFSGGQARLPRQRHYSEKVLRDGPARARLSIQEEG